MNILPFSSPSVAIENSGGKAASLARLALLGMPVPPGFIIPTDAYRQYVDANNLAEVIDSCLAVLASEEANGLYTASARIRAAFSAGRLPEGILKLVMDAYLDLDPESRGVAVRSSATTEDLPDLSFAGQQDTYLNVIGEVQLKKAIVNCWSSLWTARAIGYRMRNAIPHESAAVAVVVQRMVASDVSGVLFTANPLTGLLSESVIDATFGLGEALVSGQVEPDHYVVDAFQGTVRSVSLGVKGTVTRGKPGGGVENIREDAAERQTLSAEQVHQLVAAGRQVQEAYGSPQDIEWAFSGGELSILQARPITSLFPVPRISFDPLVVWFSLGAFQGMVGPITPLGQEAIQRIVLGLGEKLDVRIKYEEQDVLAVAGERIWIKISDLIRNPLGKRVLGGFLGIGEPGTALIMRQLTSDPRLGAGSGRIRFNTMRRLLGFILPAILELPRSIFRPEKARNRFDIELEAYLQTVHIPGGEDRYARLANMAAFLDAQGGLAEALPVLLPRFMPIMAPSLALLSLIRHLLPSNEAGEQDGSLSAMDVTRGMPRNVTTEMDLALWTVATRIKGEAADVEAFSQADPQLLAARYREGDLPVSIQAAMKSFLDNYGMRGTGEIDLGLPRWREDPAPVLRILQSYLQIEPSAAPDQVFERNVQAAKDAIERMAAEVRRQRGGWIKEKILRGAARRVRLLLGARESPKFYAVQVMDIVRKALLEIGEEFASTGTIAHGDDLFFLHVSELKAVSAHEDQDWEGLIAERRQAYERERRRRQVPRVLVSDGRAFYEGVGAMIDSDDTLTGSPVSPGMVEGVVHVVLDPRGAQLSPGEILVCPATDPAWTPLFMAAGGLVMEVGGMMTHGSVVAREYGIPAVVGVHQATGRLKNGQRIRLDGSSGRITILR